jgi:hypothetical protein
MFIFLKHSTDKYKVIINYFYSISMPKSSIEQYQEFQ